MDDIQIFGLIAQGENSSVEFKREVDLGTAKSKAEFVKDIIALANSATERAFMLVGVDNDKTIRGINKLEEETLQQVAQSYITPTVILNCYTVSVSSPAALVGVIEVKPTKKPHKAVRAIEHVGQNKVFVRRGSVVSEATPEEIILMYEENNTSAESKRYVAIRQDIVYKTYAITS